jgi:hypothetical protein
MPAIQITKSSRTKSKIGTSQECLKGEERILYTKEERDHTHSKHSFDVIIALVLCIALVNTRIVFVLSDFVSFIVCW